MEIAITSECDSRQFVYPLLKCLSALGTICIFTNNSMMNRLVEDGNEGFSNVSVYPLTPAYDGDLTTAMEDAEYVPGKWDYIIWDNVGRMEYDAHYVIVTSRVSDKYVQDLLPIIDDDDIHIIKMGSPAKIKDKFKGKKSKEEKQQDHSEIDAVYNKWNVERTEDDIFTEKVSSREASWIPWTPYEQIENLEATHNLLIPNDKFISEIYRLIGDKIAMDKRVFMKGVKLNETTKDSYMLSGVDVR